jgi:UDP-N-acetylmuramate dehydrogenase
MNREARYNSFIERFRGPVKHNEVLSAYTTFRTGGEADLFVDAAEEGQLAEAIRLAGEIDIPYFVIGGGSNLLVSDDGYRGLVIRNRIIRLDVKGNEITAGAGEDLDRVVDFATECSLSGFEFAAGIWGTIGGAVYGNAGAFGSDVGSILRHAELIDAAGNRRTETAEYFEFTYRYSKLKRTKETVTIACFGLEQGVKPEIEKRTDQIRRLRDLKHPAKPSSAGCFFKNIEDPRQPDGKLSAGKLLDEIGAKDIRVGDAAVFEKHANIVINAGCASSKDIRQLADILKEKVKEKFGLVLEEEIVSLGDF